MAHTPPQHRSCLRYSLSVPVLYRWVGDDGGERYGAGFTRDVSTAGMYIMCETHPPPIDTPLAIEVSLPSLSSQGTRMNLKAGATVVRKAGPSEIKGFAILTDFNADDKGIDG